MSLLAKSSSVTLRALAIFIIVLKLGWQVFVTHLETVVWSRCNSSASHLFVSCFSASMTFILLSCLLIIRRLFKVWMQSYKITYRCNINRPKILAENINFIANSVNLCVLFKPLLMSSKSAYTSLLSIFRILFYVVSFSYVLIVPQNSSHLPARL